MLLVTRFVATEECAEENAEEEAGEEAGEEAEEEAEDTPRVALAVELTTEDKGFPDFMYLVLMA